MRHLTFASGLAISVLLTAESSSSAQSPQAPTKGLPVAAAVSKAAPARQAPVKALPTPTAPSKALPVPAAASKALQMPQAPSKPLSMPSLPSKQMPPGWAPQAPAMVAPAPAAPSGQWSMVVVQPDGSQYTEYFNDLESCNSRRQYYAEFAAYGWYCHPCSQN